MNMHILVPAKKTHSKIIFMNGEANNGANFCKKIKKALELGLFYVIINNGATKFAYNTHHGFRSPCFRCVK
ncbi:hypothetical protein L3BBH23_13450 [Longicatena caecimuris]|nr:hypothetical protein L3BBH23_13450 [Longicatena caecimuris]